MASSKAAEYADAKITAQVLSREVVWIFGLFIQIVTDRGSHFANN